MIYSEYWLLTAAEAGSSRGSNYESDLSAVQQKSNPRGEIFTARTHQQASPVPFSSGERMSSSVL